MASSVNTAKSTAAAKTSRPVTLKHLAAALADEHQLTKRAGEAILGDLVVTSTFNLLRSLGVALPGFAALTMIAAASSGWLGWRITRTPELAAGSALPERG